MIAVASLGNVAYGGRGKKFSPKNRINFLIARQGCQNQSQTQPTGMTIPRCQGLSNRPKERMSVGMADDMKGAYPCENAISVENSQVVWV